MKQFFKISATGVHGDFIFVAKLSDKEDIKGALYFCLGNAFRITSKATKTTAKNLAGLKSFDGVNDFYFIYK